MKDQNESIFISLFHEACLKCFGTPLTEPLSETDSKQLSNAVNETTGLVIGLKSIKNYSLYVLNPSETKKENPSIATLDTLARYVLNAPETDELKRKKTEAHHPYWFQYRSRFPQLAGESARQKKPGKIRFWISAILLLALFVFVTWFLLRDDSPKHFYDAFGFTTPEILYNRGWTVQKPTEPYWENRNEKRDHLSLYTLIGDNWKDMNGRQPAGIKNLLVRKIDADCFSVEIQLSGFIPFQNWQQAGILLSEDSSFSGKALRLTIGYNDFFGGYTKPSEIIIQVVGSSIAGDLVSRFISFIIKKYNSQINLEEKMGRLQQLLLRVHMVVEEADCRHLTNSKMLLELKMLADAMYRGYHALNTAKSRTLRISRVEEDEVSSSDSISSFRSTRRTAASTYHSLQRALDGLETMVSNMTEFVLLLGGCERMFRSPYDTYLYIDNFMFGRHIEKQQVINILLQNNPTPSAPTVLPIIGAGIVGKKTLVAHVCNTQKVM
jgi:hypothetical protein